MSASTHVRSARRFAHFRAAEAFIGRCGGRDIQVEHGGAIKLRWRHGDMLMTIVLSARSKEGERGATFARQAIRRRYAAIGVEVGA